jgi:hypothetical protein
MGDLWPQDRLNYTREVPVWPLESFCILDMQFEAIVRSLKVPGQTGCSGQDWLVDQNESPGKYA